ncbi:MAG: hypothetical protein KAT70_09055 [Thermoplasmata archaeon]|nr:hypothetical protein [Thermoplasmata archaeon]
MQDKIQSRTLGNNTYHVRPLGASAGGKLFLWLVKRAGPAVAILLQDIKPGSALQQVKDAKAGKPAKPFSILDLDMANLGQALQELLFRLEDTDLEHLTTTLGMCTELERPGGNQVPLTKETQELHWAANYGEMFRWIGFALGVNYSSFLGSWGDIKGALDALGEAQAKDPEEKAEPVKAS